VVLPSTLDPWFAALLGLLVGSFLNVVIHRLPQMLERQWQAECASLASGTEASESPTKFNLMYPPSRCPHCGHLIRWYENIPVLSYLFLRGKCSSCSASISLRYPLVEIATAVVFWFCARQFVAFLPSLLWCGFGAALLCLALIDWDTTLLPDDITLPLVWAGLVAAMLGLNPLVASFSSAFWGAVAGYMSLWTIYWIFYLLTKKQGMGYGDFKLFAALGAWLGWNMLIPVILMASCIGAVAGIALKFNEKLRPGGYVPFGPFLAGAGFVVLFVGPATMSRLLGH
jgi:leader peptidase (prepilin peptidase)/N-methyltransferase